MKTEPRIIVGVDTGGTFTDVVCYDRNTKHLKAFKVPSTPKNPAVALFDGVLGTGYEVSEIGQIIYGTTIGSNAIVERDDEAIKGVAYLTTKGFEDIPFIQRIDRKSHYDLTWNKPEPLVKRTNTFGISERISYKGEVLEKIDIEQLKSIIQVLKEEARGIKSVVICFLFSYINPEHELIAKELLQKECPELLLSVSSEIYPKWKEYERSTTILSDAFLKPIITRHVNEIKSRLEKTGLKADFAFMKTNGGLMTLDSAGNNAVHTLNSGPAGGVVAAHSLASQLGLKNILTIDVGGTTCDVAAVIDDTIQYTTSFEIEYGMPIQIPMVDVKAIGTGGGSTAWIDKGGVLQVGPHSMGADPGPVCYRRGNTSCVTVTDAYLCLGYLNPDRLYGGKLRLEGKASETALKKFGEKLGMDLLETASAVIKIANNNMIRAIEVFMARRGLDIRDFSIFGFGGSGPMHVGAILMESDFQDAIIPPTPGVFSALGLLQSDPRVDFQHAVNMNSINFDVEKIKGFFDTLQSHCLEELEKEGYGGSGRGNLHLSPSLEMRYFGQNYELDVPISLNTFSSPTADAAIFKSFHQRYESEYGYTIEGEIIEILNAKLTVRKAIEKVKFEQVTNISEEGLEPVGKREASFGGKMMLTKIYNRAQLPVGTKLVGPAIIEEDTSVTIVEPNLTAEVGSCGELILRRCD
jgi:N-methylhydantoinase A